MQNFPPFHVAFARQVASFQRRDLLVHVYPRAPLFTAFSDFFTGSLNSVDTITMEIMSWRELCASASNSVQIEPWVPSDETISASVFYAQGFHVHAPSRRNGDNPTRSHKSLDTVLVSSMDRPSCWTLVVSEYTFQHLARQVAMSSAVMSEPSPWTDERMD